MTVYKKKIILPTRVLNLFLSVCRSGYFGQHCSGKCSETCVGCNHVNGSCDSRCLPGWKGGYCQEGFTGREFLHVYYDFIIIENRLVKYQNSFKSLEIFFQNI